MKLFARLAKVDEAKRLIVGIAADETPDHAGEIFDYDTSLPYFKSWSDTVSKASNGASVGNLRAMHGSTVAGKLTELACNDANKAIEITAEVVDENEWQKVLKGCYTGFSIGGKYITKWDDGVHKRYTASPSEVSLVDLGCNPNAQFEICKADGATELRKFVTAGTEQQNIPSEGEGDASVPAVAPEVTVNKLALYNDLISGGAKPEIVAASIALCEKADNADVKAGVEMAAKLVPVIFPDVNKVLAKGLYNVNSLCSILGNLDCLTSDVAYEAVIEGDKSKVPQTLVNVLADLGGALVAMVKEEVDEMLAFYSKSAPKGDLAKGDPEPQPADETLASIEQAQDIEVLRSLCKTFHSVISRQSTALAKKAPEPAAPAHCGHEHATKDLGKLNKALDESSAALNKMLADNKLLKATVANLEKETTDLKKQVETLNKMPPVQNAPKLKVVEKGEDIGAITTDPAQTDAIKNADGSVDEAATAMKKALAAPPRLIQR